jgi:hypothetical protein
VGGVGDRDVDLRGLGGQGHQKHAQRKNPSDFPTDLPAGVPSKIAHHPDLLWVGPSVSLVVGGGDREIPLPDRNKWQLGIMGFHAASPIGDQNQPNGERNPK